MDNKHRVRIALLALLALGSLAAVDISTSDTIYYTVRETKTIKVAPTIKYMSDGSVNYSLPNGGVLVDNEGYITTDEYILKSKKGPGVITRTLTELSENISQLIRKK